MGRGDRGFVRALVESGKPVAALGHEQEGIAALSAALIGTLGSGRWVNRRRFSRGALLGCPMGDDAVDDRTRDVPGAGVG